MCGVLKFFLRKAQDSPTLYHRDDETQFDYKDKRLQRVLTTNAVFAPKHETAY